MRATACCAPWARPCPSVRTVPDHKATGTNRRALIHERDAAKAALLASVHPAAAGQVFNVSDGRNHSLKEIISAICSALERKPPQFSLPVQPLRDRVLREDRTDLPAGIFCSTPCEIPVTRVAGCGYQIDLRRDGYKSLHREVRMSMDPEDGSTKRSPLWSGGGDIFTGGGVGMIGAPAMSISFL